MALTLVEAAKLSQDDLQRGVIETFILESSVLDRCPSSRSRATPTPTTRRRRCPGSSSGP